MRKNKNLIKKCSLFERLAIKIAGLAEDLKLKYPHLSTKIDYLIQRDPTRKYLQYEVKILLAGQALEGEIADVIELFHKFKEKLEKKDINAWGFTELRDKLFEIRDFGDKSKTQKKKELKEEIKKIETSGAEKLYEDDQCELLYVHSKAAACFYGKGTKWCITMENESYFEGYQSENVVFYYILRKDLDAENMRYKVAISIQRDGDNKIINDKGAVQAFLADDMQVDPGIALSGCQAGTKILAIIKQDAPQRPMGFLAKLIFRPEELSAKDYAENLNEDTKLMIAEKATDPKILAFLAKDKDEDVLLRLAMNKNCPPEILKDLYKINQNIQVAVAHNKNTPPNVLLNLVMAYKDDKYSKILSIVAGNSNAPPEALKILANINYQHIKINLAKNIKTPPDILATLSKDENREVKIQVATNPSTPVNILELLTMDTDARYYVNDNPNFSNELRTKYFPDHPPFLPDIYPRS